MYIYFKECGSEFEVSGKPEVRAMKKIFEHDYPSTVDECLSDPNLKELSETHLVRMSSIFCRSR
jgi:hypothetical protein